MCFALAVKSFVYCLNACKLALLAPLFYGLPAINPHIIVNGYSSDPGIGTRSLLTLLVQMEFGWPGGFAR